MKKIFLLLFLICIFACDKDDKPSNPIDQLPPATQTGAGTFGCLLDGQAFIPGGGTNPLDCVYQFVNGGYYFALQGNKRDSDNNRLTIGLGTNNLQIQAGQTYDLLDNSEGKALGRFYYSVLYSDTSVDYTGELKITKLDTQNQVVSGTFWFDVIHPVTSQIVKIREGRFDMQYTQ